MAAPFELQHSEQPIADVSIANPCWGDGEAALRTAVDTLHEAGVQYIDVAPTMVFPELKEGKQIEDIDASEVDAYLTKLAHSDRPGGQRLQPAGMQSLTYGRPESIFSGFEGRELRDYMGEVIGLAGKLGVKTMIYGSPGTRHIEGRSEDEVLDKAINFFGPLGALAASHDVVLGIEPVSTTWTKGKPVFGRTAADILDFIGQLRSEGYYGVQLVADSFAMHDGGDDIAAVIQQARAARLLAPHAQMAQPAMGVPTIADNPLAATHQALETALHGEWQKYGETTGLRPVLAVEMNPRKTTDGTRNVEGAELAQTLRGVVAAARSHYAELVV